MVLPAGTSIPPLPHLLVLAAGAAVVGWLLRRERPPVTEPVILALAPWMVVGATAHVLYQIDAAPAPVAPFLGTPAVYVATGIVAGATWLAVRYASGASAREDDGTSAAKPLGWIGAVSAAAVAGLALGAGGVVRYAVPLAALVVGLLLAGAVWFGLARRWPDEAATTGGVGALVVLGHAVDGVSTAVGVDVLGFGERSPVSRAIMDLAGTLPTADLIGVGWLFVLVKLAVAVAVVVVFAEYVREEPTPGYALLGVIAAVGLGPGAHNVLLYAVASP